VEALTFGNNARLMLRDNQRGRAEAAGDGIQMAELWLPNGDARPARARTATQAQTIASSLSSNAFLAQPDALGGNIGRDSHHSDVVAPFVPISSDPPPRWCRFPQRGWGTPLIPALQQRTAHCTIVDRGPGIRTLPSQVIYPVSAMYKSALHTSAAPHNGREVSEV
jgi:hypothetical protein